MEKEIRTLNTEFKAEEENRTIEGVSIVFNQLSEDLGGFREMISPDAVVDVIEESDIFMLYNHDRSKGYLARSRQGKGTLHIDVMEDGVHFNFKAPRTALAEEVREHMLAGDTNQCSFAFTVAEDRWAKQEDGTYIRTILKFDRLYDFSIVDTPAYSQTSASCRAFDEFKEKEARELAEQKAKEEEEARLEEERKTKEAIAQQHQKMLDEYAKYLPADNK